SQLREEVDSGRHYLPGTLTGERETIVTSAIDARPEYLLRLPGPSWLPVFAGLGTAAFFLCLTVKLFIPSMIGAVVALVSIFKWLWQSEPASTNRLYDIGSGVELRDHMSGRRSHSWWAMVVLMLVDGTIFSCLVFAYFYFWTVSAKWPPPPFDLPGGATSIAAAIAWSASAAVLAVAHRWLRAGIRRGALIASLVG